MTCGRSVGVCDHPMRHEHKGGCLNLEDWDYPIWEVPNIDYSKATKVFFTEIRQERSRHSGEYDQDYIYVCATGSTSPARYLFNPQSRKRVYFYANSRAQIINLLSRVYQFADPWRGCDRVEGQYGSSYRPYVHGQRAPELRNITALMVGGGCAISIEDLTINLPDPITITAKESTTVVTSPNCNNAEALRQQAERMLARADELDSRPVDPFDEQDPDSPEPMLIWWTMNYRATGKTYVYSATKTPDGWYTSGPRTPKAYSWTDLINWIYANHDPEFGDVEIWVATEFGQI